MSQKHTVSSWEHNFSSDFFSICTKIEIDFLQAACQWLGMQFQAKEVSLYANFPDNHFFESSSQSKPALKNKVAHWSLPNSEQEHSFSDDEVIQKKSEVLPFVERREELRARTSSENEGSDSLETRPLHSRDQRLSVPVIPDWTHETFFVLGGCEKPLPTISFQVLADCSEPVVSPTSIILQRTPVELSSFVKGKQKEEQIAAFHTLISSIPDSVFAKDQSLRYCMINDAFCKMFGKTREEIIGRSEAEIFGDRFIDPNEMIGQRVLGGETVRFENIFEELDLLKSYRTINSPVRNKTGDIIGLCGISHEITDLKTYEEQLKQANSFQQAVIRTASEGVCVGVPVPEEPYLRFTIWNDRIADLTGYSLEEINQINWASEVVKHELGSKYILRRLRQLLDGKQFQEEEFDLLSKTGEHKHVLVSSSQVVNGKHREATVILAHDITARTRVQKSLDESRSRYYLATRNAKISVWEWNLLTEEVADDGNLARILGYPEEEMRSIDAWRNKVHPDDAALVAARCAAFADGETEELIMEKRMRHSNGHWVWVATQGRFLSNDKHSKIAIGTDLDITKQKENADRLAELQEEMLQITRLSTVGEIAASLAHDITQPVTAICNYAAAASHLLKLPEQEGSHLTAAGYLKKIEHVSKIATNVLKGVRSYINEPAGEQTRLTLGELVDGVLEVSASDIRRRDIQLNRLSDADGSFVQGDRAQLITVLMNLINNSIESLTKSLARKPEITISTSIQESDVVISIRDNGLGLTQEQSRSIFKPFYSTKTGGMGIGLAICKTLVEANSGSITAKKMPEQGAVFIIRFPQIL